MNAKNEARVECTNWNDEVLVATWAKGRGKKPSRKVMTNGTERIGLSDRMGERVVGLLSRGMEVRLEIAGEDAIRLYPCAMADFKTMFVATEAMGDFRHAPYRGRKLAFTSKRGRRRIGEEEIGRRVARACGTAQERPHVTPDTVVTCPKCGAEFRVGKTLS